MRIFVYGTLKQGFRNFHINRGTRVPGEFVTEVALPLYVIGEFGIPGLGHEPGQGHPVVGQVFEVDADTLAAMDVLERVSDGNWYRRLPLHVRPRDGGAPVDVEAYFGASSRLQQDTVHEGPLAEYTLAHQALFSDRW
jgi:gamma-glutamylaminecyclotransferase